jgi:hypothetical protein
MTTQLLVMGIPMVLFVFGLWVGVPLWMVLRHPDRDPRETRTVPAYLRNRGIAPAAFPAQRQAPERDDAERRELVSASR